MVLAAITTLCSTSSPLFNTSLCLSLLARASKSGAKLVCLPEASDFIAPAKDVYGLSDPLDESRFVSALREAARTEGVWVSVGVHERASIEREKGTEGERKCYNTQLLIEPTRGEIVAAYRKVSLRSGIPSPSEPLVTCRGVVPLAPRERRLHQPSSSEPRSPSQQLTPTPHPQLHLFDLPHPSSGPPLLESNTTHPGDSLLPPSSTPLGSVGLLTCYDLRFPEVSLSLRRRGAQILTYPSAFTVRTGAAHWEVLLRARAIETQCYVCELLTFRGFGYREVVMGH